MTVIKFDEIIGKGNLYYNFEVCVCVRLCTLYLKMVNGNDLILFVS